MSPMQNVPELFNRSAHQRPFHFGAFKAISCVWYNYIARQVCGEKGWDRSCRLWEGCLKCVSKWAALFWRPRWSVDGVSERLFVVKMHLEPLGQLSSMGHLSALSSVKFGLRGGNLARASLATTRVASLVSAGLARARPGEGRPGDREGRHYISGRKQAELISAVWKDVGLRPGEGCSYASCQRHASLSVPCAFGIRPLRSYAT